MLSVVRELKLPIVLFAEGGGGRPGEVDAPWVAGLNVPTFRQFAALSGQVPVVGVVHGFCFAGNAALLGCAEVIIATEAANIGMGGPAPVFTVAWPTGEFGPMGLEGAVKLGFRKELEAAAPGPERTALYNKLVAQQYANGSAINMATGVEIDAVIDPAETRSWLVRGLDSAARQPPAAMDRFVDSW
jgi:acetyl-CoA carboxylase carboxyltransferase component